EAQGRRLTGCRHVRGTHGGTYVYDPEGTDEPPDWWSPAAAVRAYGTPARRRGAAPDAEARAADAEAARAAVVQILTRLRERSGPPEVRGDTPPPATGGRPGGRRLALG